jgi:hypothetical protein
LNGTCIFGNEDPPWPLTLLAVGPYKGHPIHAKLYCTTSRSQFLASSAASMMLEVPLLEFATARALVRTHMGLLT